MSIQTSNSVSNNATGVVSKQSSAAASACPVCDPTNPLVGTQVCYQCTIAGLKLGDTVPSSKN